MNPIDVVWIILKNRGDALERLHDIMMHPRNATLDEEDLDEIYMKLMQAIGDGHDVTPHDVDRALGAHILTEEGSETDDPEIGENERVSMQEMLHDLLDTGAHFGEWSGDPATVARQSPIEATGPVGALNTEHHQNRTSAIECPDTACSGPHASQDIEPGGIHTNYSEPLWVCTYEDHHHELDNYNAENEDTADCYDDRGYLWLDNDGDPIRPPYENIEAHEDFGGDFDSTDASERGDDAWEHPDERTMTERGMRRFENREGEPVPHEGVRGLVPPLTAASQGEGRVGPDVMDENQLIRYEAPQLREMISSIQQELQRREELPHNTSVNPTAQEDLDRIAEAQAIGRDALENLETTPPVSRYGDCHICGDELDFERDCVNPRCENFYENQW